MTIVAVIFATKPDAKSQYYEAVKSNPSWKGQIDPKTGEYVTK